MFYRNSVNASLDKLAEVFADIKIVCSDGVLLWNRSLLAASSPFLREILSEDDCFLIVDCFSSITIRKCLTVMYGGDSEDILNDDEISLIYNILKIKDVQ